MRASIVAAVLGLWATLYGSLPAYPPRLGLSLAAVAVLFLAALILIRRMYGDDWPRLAQFGLVVSTTGLGLWIVGGLLNALGVTVAEFIAHPQAGWGLFSVGLVPIGVTAIRRRWSPAIRLLVPLGLLFIPGELMKQLIGERAGGLTVFVAFGVLWLMVAALLQRRRKALVVLCAALAFSGCSSPDRVIMVDDEDPEMIAAIAEARDHVGEFVAALKAPLRGDRDFSLKAPLRDGREVEHVWINDLAYDGTAFTGTLGNDPELVTGHRFGESVRVLPGEISDWMFVRRDRLVGGYSFRLLRRRMNDSERAQLDKGLGFKVE